MLLFFYTLGLPAVACLVAGALFWLPSRTTGWAVRLNVGAAWLAALASLMLVPIDVASTLMGVRPAGLASWWKATYWYAFLTSVLVLPVHMEHTRRGEFDEPARLLGALRYNLAYYATLVGVGALGLAALLATGRLALHNVVGFCIAFSNAYGLIGAIFLMGYGLVGVPKALWRSADRAGEYRRLAHAAGVQAGRALEARKRLSECALRVRAASVLFGPRDPLRPAMDAVLRQLDEAGPDFTPSPDARPPGENDLDVFDLADLADLRRSLKAALKDNERESALYGEVVEAALRLEERRARAGQAVFAASAAAHAPPAPTQAESSAPDPYANGNVGLSSAAAGLRQRLEAAFPSVAGALGAASAEKLHVAVWRSAAVLAGSLSFAVVLAETTMSSSLPDLSLVSRLLRASSGSALPTELTALLCLAYPCACAYYAVYRAGQISFYRMVPGHTDAYSLCYSALLVCRFATPLAFNFMAAIAMPARGSASPDPSAPAPRDVTSTAFYEIFGKLMDSQPLIGWRFTTFAPLALAPYCLLVALGLFNPVARLFRRTSRLQFEDDWEEASGAGTAGRRLLRLEAEAAAQGLSPGLGIASGQGAPGSLAGSRNGSSAGGFSVAAFPSTGRHASRPAPAAAPPQTTALARLLGGGPAAAAAPPPPARAAPGRSMWGLGAGAAASAPGVGASPSESDALLGGDAEGGRSDVFASLDADSASALSGWRAKYVRGRG